MRLTTAQKREVAETFYDILEDRLHNILEELLGYEFDGLEFHDEDWHDIIDELKKL
jgi:hypothetical protein